VPVIEEFLQSPLDQQRSDRASYESKWRFIVYFIPQNCPIDVRLNDVLVTPTAKRAFDLDVLKLTWWIIHGVLRNPTHSYGAKNSCLDYRLRINF
jgi:hypothetical protein